MPSRKPLSSGWPVFPVILASNRMAARLEDRDQIRLRDRAGRDCENQFDEFAFIEGRFPLIHQQERDRGVGSNPFVAVDECVVLAKMEQVGG